jgi:hypothetical protein
MSLIRMALLSTLASGLALTACNRTETASLPSAPTEENGQLAQPSAVPGGFAEEYRALKTREKDPVKLAAEIQDMLARYQLPAPERSSASSIPGPVTLPAADENPAAGSLGKIAAAAATTKFYVVKSRDFHLDFVVYKTMTIPANATLAVTINHDPATSILDPFAVAFYKPAGANPNFTKVTIAALDDDAGGNLNSSFSWLNNTGASRVVTIIGFAYLPEVSGVGAFRASCRTAANVSCGLITQTTWMSGVAERVNDTPDLPTCTGPFQSSISLSILSGADHGPGVLAVNAATKRGGFIYTQEGVLALTDVLPAAYPNFVLGFSSGIGGFPCGTSTCYESPNDYQFMQADGYSCQ